MPKTIAVISYSLNPTDSLTADAIVFRDTLLKAGYQAKLVPQSFLDETSTATFKKSPFWKAFDGIVITSFYYYWPMREVILSNSPVICANVGYVDDLGLGEAPLNHAPILDFTVTNNTHPITNGMPLGNVNIGGAVWADATSTLDHFVNVLAVTATTKQPVLTAHKTHHLVYFGWYRMSQAPVGSSLFQLLVRAAKWAF